MKHLIGGLIASALVIGVVIAIPTVTAYADQKHQQATLVAEQRSKRHHDNEQEHCLALNIYFEARGSNYADKIAVADVVLNRTIDRRYPSTVCDVVKDGYKPGKNSCQFSWYCDKNSDIPKDKAAWKEAQALAYQMLTYGKYRGITEGATHYHADYVNPRWASSLQMVGRIGSHVFYRWE